MPEALRMVFLLLPGQVMAVWCLVLREESWGEQGSGVRYSCIRQIKSLSTCFCPAIPFLSFF